MLTGKGADEAITAEVRKSIDEEDFLNLANVHGEKGVDNAGATRKVPGRKGMSWEEEDWIDEEATSHRGPEE